VKHVRVGADIIEKFVEITIGTACWYNLGGDQLDPSGEVPSDEQSVGEVGAETGPAAVVGLDDLAHISCHIGHCTRLPA
jgi:hypothetical protein